MFNDRKRIGKIISFLLILTVICTVFLPVIPANAAVAAQGPLRILEIQPGTAYDIDSTIQSTLQTFYGRSIELTQMPMSLFISKADEVNGYYDIVYIGNNTSGGASYSQIGPKAANKPNISANAANDVEYYNGNDITNLAATKLKSFIESKQLAIFDDSIFTSGINSTKLYQNFIQYRKNASYANFLTPVHDVAWFDDSFPAGSVYEYNNDYQLNSCWNAISGITAYSGNSHHASKNKNGFHQHDFYNASATMKVSTGDKLFTYVYIKQDTSELMLQWREGTSWEHRAYWGSNNIAYGSNGTASRFYEGNLPAKGQWVRLEVKASDIGLEGKTINGMAFSMYDGQASWDYSGENSYVLPVLPSLESYNGAGIMKRPVLNITSSPVQYDGTNTITNGGIMGFTMNLANSNGNDPMTVRLYMDKNGDGIYQQSEVVGIYNNVSSMNGYTLNYPIPVNFSGLISWKMEVTDKYGAKAYQTGYSAYKGTELQLRVLQLLPANSDNSATFHLSSLSNVNVNGQWQNMLHRSGEYNITVTEMKINDFDNNYGSYVNNKPTILNGNYDMVVVGFDDSYVGDLTNNHGALNALAAFADSGQSIMFTHDTIGFSTTNMVNVTNTFRTRLGQNAFATDTSMPEAGKTSYGMTRLALDYANGKLPYFPDTVLTHKINESDITRYPYVLGDIPVSPTHLQYLRLDAEDPGINVAFTYQNQNRYIHQYRGATLYTPVTPETLYHQYDGINDYYTYSKGNLTFSGTGHSIINSVPEQQMFVNTMLKASKGANHAPSVQIGGLTAGQNIPPSQATLSFNFMASDIDLGDQILSANIYIDRNNNGIPDSGELYTFNAGDTVTYNKSITNGVVQNVTLPVSKLSISDTATSFGIIVELFDNGGAKTSQSLQLKHLNQPTLTVSASGNNCLIGDTAPVSLDLYPASTGVSNEFRNMSITVDLSNFSKDISVTNTSGWTVSGGLYTMSLPNLVFSQDAQWSGNNRCILPISVLKNSQRTESSYGVGPIPVTLKYDRYDTVTKSTNTEIISSSMQVNASDGRLAVYTNDKSGVGINGATVNVSGPTTVSGTSQSGGVYFHGLKAGSYTVTLTIPAGYVNAGSILTGTVYVNYSSCSNGNIPSVTFGVTLEIPQAPTDLRASAGDGNVRLDWVAPVGESSNYTYNIKRGTSPNGTFTNIATGITLTNYTDKSVSNGITYYYEVSAVNPTNRAEGAVSVQAGATPLSALAAPAGVSAQAANGRIAVSWNPLQGATGYNVYKTTTSGIYNSTPFYVSKANSYVDSSVTDGVTYYYSVTAINANGMEGQKSSEVCAILSGLSVVPGIKVIYKDSDGSSTVYWSWDNQNSYPVTVSASDSKFSGGTPTAGSMTPPVTFNAGQGSFFTKFQGASLTWTVKGPDGVTNSVTANKSSAIAANDPGISLLSPVNASKWEKGSTVKISASGNNCDQIEAYINNTLLGTQAGNKFNMTLTLDNSGPYTIYVKGINNSRSGDDPDFKPAISPTVTVTSVDKSFQTLIGALNYRLLTDTGELDGNGNIVLRNEKFVFGENVPLSIDLTLSEDITDPVITFSNNLFSLDQNGLKSIPITVGKVYKSGTNLYISIKDDKSKVYQFSEISGSGLSFKIPGTIHAGATLNIVCVVKISAQDKDLKNVLKNYLNKGWKLGFTIATSSGTLNTNQNNDFLLDLFVQSPDKLK